MTEATPPPAPLMSEIRAAVSIEAQLRPDELLSRSKLRSVARPRQVAMYLAREMTRHSLPDIGRHFAGRDHTTVIHAVRQIERLRSVDAELDLLVRRARTRSADLLAERIRLIMPPDRPEPETQELQLEMFA